MRLALPGRKPAQVERHLDLPGSRICVVGTSGSGKTFVAQDLAVRLGLTYISNDALIWRTGWEEVPNEERPAAFAAATAGSGWTLDGNLSLHRPEDRLVFDRCDTLVWLDLPRWQVHGQVVLRSIWRLLTRERLWHGNVERWSTTFSSDSIVWWSIKTFRRRRRDYRAIFDSPDFADKARIRLRSRREVARWLSALATGHR
jgi:adenylate kinase family enzyme